MAQKLRVGVIGAGGFAEVCHIPGIQSHPDAEVVALCGRRAGFAREMADRFGIPDVHTDYRELCSRTDLDAVTITTPNHVHAEQAILAFQHGKHVFCEKPLGMNVKEVERMYDAARRSGKVHMVAFTFRYTYCLQEMRRRVLEGEIGEPYYLRTSYDGWGGLRSDWTISWREDQAEAGGGMLFDMGSHLFDVSQFLAGPIESSTGMLHTVPRERIDRRTGVARPVETDDVSAAWFRTVGGLRGEWFMSRATPLRGPNGCVEIIGPQGAFRSTLSRGNTEKLWKSTPECPDWCELALPEEAASGTPHALGLMMRSFVDACFRGSAVPGLDADFADGLAIQRCLSAVIEGDRTLTWQSCTQ